MKLIRVNKKDWDQGDWQDKDWIEILKTINKKSADINSKHKLVNVNFVVNGKILTVEVVFVGGVTGGMSLKSVNELSKNLSKLIADIKKAAVELEDKFGFTFREQ